MLFYHNTINHTDINLTGSRDTQKIPQITSRIDYKTQIRSKSILPEGVDADFYQPNDSDPVLQDQIYQDGSFVEVSPDHILIELQEKNAPFLRENFDIEVYEIKDENLLDNEIDEVVICKSINKLRSKGIYVETDYECPDLMPIVSKVDPYSTLDIENPSDECAVEISTGGSKQ